MAQSAPILTAALFAFLAALAAIDSATHRIPNALTVPAAAVAVVLHGLSTGTLGVLESAAGLSVGLLVFAPFYLGRNFGAGDLKAMAAVGAFLGPAGGLAAAGWTLVAGGVGALLWLISVGGYSALHALFERWATRAYVLCATGHRARLNPSPGDAALRRFPYGLAIACGTSISLLWRS